MVVIYGSSIYLCNQCISIITNILSSNSAHGEVCSLELYVIKFVSDLRHVGDFHRVLIFPSSIKLTDTI